MPRTESACRIQETFARAMEPILARVFPGNEGEAMKVGLAFSGGLDSSVLLYLLGAYARERPLRIHAFHIHHGLSPNADAWAAHCRQTAQSFGAEFDSWKVRIDLDAAPGVEGTARIERYGALAALCRRHGVPLLLTAHHRDDQAETVLLQAMRGAGIGGLAGMAGFQEFHPLLGRDVGLARPLIGVTRDELEAVAARAGLMPVDDESNRDVRFRRNAVRQVVLPAMEAASPGCRGALARVASHAQSALRLLDDLAQMDWTACGVDPGSKKLALRPMQSLSADRQRNLVRYWLRAQGVQLPSTTALEAFFDQMTGAPADAQPVFRFAAVECRRHAGYLELVRGSFAVPPPVRFRWAGEDVIDFPDWHGRLRFVSGPEGLPRSLLHAAVLELRLRQGGERIQPHPARPRKTLKNLYQESAVPSWQRERLPLLYAGQSLLFAAGLGMNHEYFSGEPGEERVSLGWEAAGSNEHS